MITVQEAVTRAVNYYNTLPYKAKHIVEMLVDEVEYSEKENCYFITLGFILLDKTKTKSPVGAALGVSPPFLREYKIFKVDALSGFVHYMKIRKI